VESHKHERCHFEDHWNFQYGVPLPIATVADGVLLCSSGLRTSYQGIDLISQLVSHGGSAINNSSFLWKLESLHHALPPLHTVDNPRVRGHPDNLPDCNTNVQKKSFVVRSLYGFI